MLGKLIKYDFRSCWKKFWPVWAAVIVISLINGWSLNYCEQYQNYEFFPNTLPKILLFAIAIAATVIAVLYIYNEFCHGLLGSEGYLRFTLPAREEELIASKAITALIMETISGILVVICVLLMAFISTPEYIANMFKDIMRFFTSFDDSWIMVVFGIELILLAMVSAMMMNLYIYTAVSAGHLFQKNRRVATVAAMIIIFVILIIIGIYVYSPIVSDVYREFHGVKWRDDIFAVMISAGVAMLLELFIGAAMFAFVRYVLKNKLNLE